MSLSNWTIYRDGQGGPTGSVYIDIVNPISGSGSLVVTQLPGIELQSINITPSTLPTGVSDGRLQSLLRLDATDGVSGVESHFGFLCMQSAENMAQFGTSNTAYGFSLSVGGVGIPSSSLRLWKFSEGLDGSSGSLNASQILLSVPPPFPILQGQILAMELEWHTNSNSLSEFGGALLIGRLGQMIDFSDLQNVITFIDTTPYTLTTSESVFAVFKNAFSTESKKVSFDNTILRRILLN